MAWLSGCKKRFGIAKARELAHFFYTHRIEQAPNCTHLVDYYLKMVQTITASETQPQFIFPQAPEAIESVNTLLTQNGIKPNNYAVFIPGSAHSDKCWPIQRFALLADKISSQFHLSIIAVGTEPETDTIENLKDLANVPIANLAGRTSISELIALLKTARLVISNDTGPGHIAAALGVPVVVIFGRSNPARVAPYNRKQCVAAIEPQSRGFKPDSTEAKHHIKFVTFDEVYRKVCQQLKPQTL